MSVTLPGRITAGEGSEFARAGHSLNVSIPTWKRPGLSLERLDNNDGYGPHNCTWRAQKSATTKPAPERSLEVTGSRRSRHECLDPPKAPCLISPCHASPCRASPRLASPCHAAPGLALPKIHSFLRAQADSRGKEDFWSKVLSDTSEWMPRSIRRQ